MVRRWPIYSHNSQVEAPTMPDTDPIIEPNQRPRRCISSAAGNTRSITPMCCMVIGSIAGSRVGKKVSTESAVAPNILVGVGASGWSGRQA
jgi:hypothetical protein